MRSQELSHSGATDCVGHHAPKFCIIPGISAGYEVSLPKSIPHDIDSARSSPEPKAKPNMQLNDVPVDRQRVQHF